ncbi:elongin A-related [Schistosoma mansoni]|uniref:elongin A-related n=1 Tax=Schistosoma mansoni TaxID=6183 RepID=UPI0001A64063|nr:elongin A-related [Schistosoma mansoni]|eukprot:XP_018646670.1 elongin A-related [Schistosoma mansoni]
MSASVVAALVKFGETLGDKSVDTSSKLRVLSTLNEVKLTLSELSESGVGRAVRKLKNEPGELGKTASTLILKWKNLLSEHIKQESINISVPKDSEKCDVNETSRSHSQTSSKGKSVLVVNDKTISSNKSPENNLVRSVQHVDENEVVPNTPNNSLLPTATTSGYLPNSSTSDDSCSYTKVNHKSPNSKIKSTSSKKRKSAEIVDSIDSSSGISFMDSLKVNANTLAHRKRKCNLTSSSSDDSQQSIDKKLNIATPNIPLRPSEAFSAEIISSLSEPVNRPDVVHRSPTLQLDETVEDDFDNGDLKFKSKKVLWVPKQNRSSLPPNNHSNTSDNFPGFFDPPSLIDLCVDVLSRNISRVDHVGHVPYGLLEKALRSASVDDLTRIERYNPQFVGLSDDLWRKYVNRDFHHLSNIRRRSDETWCDFYNRLSKEETKRLDRIISQSARKVKEELEVLDQPRNMSHPSPIGTNVHGKISRPIASTSNTTTSNSNAGVGGGGLLSKLRKQFHSGHLR